MLSLIYFSNNSRPNNPPQNVTVFLWAYGACYAVWALFFGDALISSEVASLIGAMATLGIRRAISDGRQPRRS